MRLLLVNTFYPPEGVGGAEESVRELAHDLQKRGHHVAVFCLGATTRSGTVHTLRAKRSNDGQVVIYRLRTAAVNYYFNGRVRPAWAKALWHLGEIFRIRSFIALRAVIRAESPDVVHVHGLSGIGLPAWICAGNRPLVHTAREYSVVCSNTRTFKAGRNCEKQCASCKVLRGPFLLSPRKPEVLVGLTQASLKRLHLFGFQAERSQVVLNRPQLAVGTPKSQTRYTTFGYIGRLEPYKGVRIVTEAFCQLNIANSKLLIAGDGSEDDRSWVEAQAERDERIEYLGRVEKQKFYTATDVVLVPSQWHEPFGRTAAEAVVCGAAVIVSDVGGLPEAVQEAQLKHVVVDYSNVEAWAEAMSGFVGQRRGVPTNTSDSEVADLYLDIYRRLMKAEDERG